MSGLSVIAVEPHSGIATTLYTKYSKVPTTTIALSFLLRATYDMI